MDEPRSIDGQSQWITGPRRAPTVIAWRARACAILTGIGTVLQDDPQMNVRAVATTRQPRRVIVDRHGQTPASARILDGGGVLIVTAGERNPAWPEGVETMPLPDAQGRVDLAAMLRALADREILELHVEAGAKLNGALLDAGLIDESCCTSRPACSAIRRGACSSVRGRSRRSRIATEFAFRDVQRVGADLRIVARRSRDGRRLMFTGIVQMVGRITSATARCGWAAARRGHRRARNRRRCRRR